MDLEKKIGLHHAKMERKHAARRARKKTGLEAQATKWPLKWQRRTAKFAGKAPAVAAVAERAEKEVKKPVKAMEERIKPVSWRLKKELYIFCKD